MYTGILYHNPYTNFLYLIVHVFITKDVSSYYYYCISRICRVKYLHVLSLEIQLSRGESWDPVIKRRELGSSYQEGRVGIQLSRGESWDPVIKRGELGSRYQKGRFGDPVIKRGDLGSSYQEGMIGIQLSRGERSSYQEGMIGIQLSRGDDWDPVIKRGELGSSYQEGMIGIPLSGLTLPRLCTCPKPGSGFPTLYVIVFLVFNEFRGLWCLTPLSIIL